MMVNGRKIDLEDYQETWSFLQRYRPLRCHLCPDGTGELADIACGDAWHLFDSMESEGISVALARTEEGLSWLLEAQKDGFVFLRKTTLERIRQGQGLTTRRKEVWGRTVAFRLLGIPVPVFRGFKLFHAWWGLSLWLKIKTVLGTLRRIVTRRLFIPQRNRYRRIGKKVTSLQKASLFCEDR